MKTKLTVLLPALALAFAGIVGAGCSGGDSGTSNEEAIKELSQLPSNNPDVQYDPNMEGPPGGKPSRK
jgi:hypothetical protein